MVARTKNISVFDKVIVLQLSLNCNGLLWANASDHLPVIIGLFVLIWTMLRKSNVIIKRLGPRLASERIINL